MDYNDVKLILKSNDVNYIYHINTVVTSLTYINNGGLLSRGEVENLRLQQTPQETDQKDKIINVYNDIFFDSVDIHQRAKRLNDYGPITFVYELDVLDDLQDYEICITKDNPKYWDDSITEKDKYFINAIDLSSGFEKGNFRQHITIRNIYRPIDFKHLKEIIIDDPGIPNDSYFNNAFNELSESILNVGISMPINARSCPVNCICKQQYYKRKEGYTYYRFRTKI
ncbi:MAG: hypothetical protein ACYC00_19055 [Eubacteriales bacterium]